MAGLSDGGAEDTSKPDNMGLNCETAGHLSRAAAQIHIMLIIAKAFHNSVRQTFGRRGISRRKMTAHSIMEPGGDAANSKGCGRHTLQCRLNSDDAKRFRP